jgi:hypothetical protein
VEHYGNLERHKNVLLPAKTQIFKTTHVQMEQRSLWEHLPRKKTAGTKTRGPSGKKHSLGTHNHSITGGE